MVSSETTTWVTAKFAAQARKCSIPAIHRGAITGDIRTRLVPGKKPEYCLEDAKKLVLFRNRPLTTEVAGA